MIRSSIVGFLSTDFGKTNPNYLSRIATFSHRDGSTGARAVQCWMTANDLALRRVLEAAGIESIDENRRQPRTVSALLVQDFKPAKLIFIKRLEPERITFTIHV